jgi:hypothetical protein
MAWDPSYFDSYFDSTSPWALDPSLYFNPWPIKYLIPAVKWFPLYWPNAEWKVVPFPPTPGKGPVPPDDALLQWWDLPKDQWPLEAPWEPKLFGCWPASKVTMSEDLPPSIWPGGHRAPPFGFIKLRMPGTPDISGDQNPKGNQIFFTKMKMHMRPDHMEYYNRMKFVSHQTPMGQKFYLLDDNWNQHEYEAKEYRAAVKRRRQEKFREMLAAEIANYNGEPKPSKDLFV